MAAVEEVDPQKTTGPRSEEHYELGVAIHRPASAKEPVPTAQLGGAGEAGSGPTIQVVGSDNTDAVAPGAYAEGGRPDFARPQPRQSGGNGNQAASPNDGLVEARLVSEDRDPEQADLEEASPLHPEDMAKDSKSYRSRYIGFALAVAAVCAAITALAIHHDKDKTKSMQIKDHHPATQAPTSVADRLSSLLPSVTLDAIEDRGLAGDEDSPQRLAYQWMLDDPFFLDYPEDRLIQRFALACLFFSTGGFDWSDNEHWLSYSHHECTWHNSFNSDCRCENDYQQPKHWPCDSLTNQTYQKLQLIANDLVGTLPPELFLMTSLESIFIRRNHDLRGTIPSDLMNRSEKLEILSLSGNGLTGTIPTELARFNQLHSLGLCCNDLTGELPAELGLFSPQKMIRLILDTNQFSGSIPTELGNLSNMTDLRLGLNSLTGNLPSELAFCSNLESLLLSDLLLSGSIPSEFGVFSQLWALSMDKTCVTGTLPTEIGEWESMTFLNIDNNPNLTGSIPSELGLWNKAWLLVLSNNALTGSIPTEVGQLQSVHVLQLDQNFFSGSMPTELGTMAALTELTLHDNQLTGMIPSQLGLAMGMKSLQLQNNMLTGVIPMEIGRTTNTTLVLNVSNTHLSGTIPQPMCGIDDISFDCGYSLCGCADCPCSG